jgi:hypothetical protein
VKDTIEADNYNYTKNITKKVIDNFNNDVYSKDNNSVVDVLKINKKNNVWGDYKRTVAQIYDYLKEEYKNLKIIFDGNEFEIWIPKLEKSKLNNLKKDLNDKFKSSDYHNLNFLSNSKKTNIYQINKDNGIVSSEVKRNKLLEFKKNNNTIDKIYKKVKNKNFKWDNKKESKMNTDEKLKIAKKVQEYFKFMQDQLKEMYGGKTKSPMQLEDRERDNFFKQVKKLWKNKNEK